VAARAQRLRERDQVDGLVALRELEHRREELAVRAAVEVVGLDQLDEAVERRVVEQDAAEHGLLGLEALRRDPTKVLVDRRHPPTPPQKPARRGPPRGEGKGPARAHPPPPAARSGPPYRL